jgi:hypothetical protein
MQPWPVERLLRYRRLWDAGYSTGLMGASIHFNERISNKEHALKIKDNRCSKLINMTISE